MVDRVGYGVGPVDIIIAACALISTFFFFYLTYSDIGSLDCGDTPRNTTATFTSTHVNVLQRYCGEDTGLFAVAMLTAFFVQFARGLLSWELNQEARVLLNKSANDRGDACALWSGYYGRYLLAQLGGVLAIVLIIAMNLWINLALVFGSMSATIRYMCKSPSDEERVALLPAPSAPVVTLEGARGRHSQWRH